MKRPNLLFVLMLVLLSAGMLTSQTFAQSNFFSDAKSENGTYKTGPAVNSDGSRNGCSYVLDDGTQENSLGLTSGGDIMWINYFTATGGCETISLVSLTWGDIQNGGTCRIIIYEDPTDDGDPSDAVYLGETSTTVVNANTNIFTNVPFPATTVSGGFFVAALYQNQTAGEFPAPLDETSSMGDSWVAGEGTPGGFDVNDLSNNGIPPLEVSSAGFPGNFLLRAEGGPAAEVPLSDWAIYGGIFLILVFTAVRFKKFLF